MNLSFTIKEARLILRMTYEFKQDWIEYKSPAALNTMDLLRKIDKKIWSAMTNKQVASFKIKTKRKILK